MNFNTESNKSKMIDCLNNAVDNGFETISGIKKEAEKLYSNLGLNQLDFHVKTEIYRNYFNAN